MMGMVNAPAAQKSQPEASAPASQARAAGASLTPDVVAGFLGLSPGTWETIGKAGEILGFLSKPLPQANMPSAPNLGVSFTAPAAQFPMMQAPPLSVSQAAPQFPYIGVPGNRQMGGF